MVKIVVEISKYLLLLLMVFFTLETFMVLRRKNEEARRRIMAKQIVLLLLFNFSAYLVMFMQSGDIYMILMYVGVMTYILIVQGLYRLIYRKASLILLNTMCMLLSVGFVIQSRLGIQIAVRQLIIVAVSTMLSFVIPRHRPEGAADAGSELGLRGNRRTAAGRGAVVYAQAYGGGKLSLNLFGVTFQFSEFVKITFVFFVAGMLQEITTFRQVVRVSVVAGIHVIILVLSHRSGRRADLFRILYCHGLCCHQKSQIRASGLGAWRARQLWPTGCFPMCGSG